MSDAKRIVAEGYDRIGDSYRPWFDRTMGPVRSWFLSEIAARVSSGTDLLELGCGAGIDAVTLAQGRGYTGVDISETMIRLARERVPTGTFLHGDLASLAFAPESFDAVVSLYVFGHLPAAEHVPTFRRIFDWLRPGGVFCASFPSDIDPDGTEDDYVGVTMFFAGIGREATESGLRESGFDLELSEVREEVEPTGETVSFLWTIGRKPGTSP